MTVFLVHAPKQNNVQKNYSKIHLQKKSTHRHTKRFPGGRKFSLASIYIHNHGERYGGFRNTNKMTNFYEWEIFSPNFSLPPACRHEMGRNFFMSPKRFFFRLAVHLHNYFDMRNIRSACLLVIFLFSAHRAH